MDAIHYRYADVDQVAAHAEIFRLLAYLGAGDGEGAALEMERHLRVLLYMWRLALPGSRVAMGRAVK